MNNRVKKTDTSGILFNKKSYVISDLGIFSFILRYMLAAASTFLIVFICFNSFNIETDMATILKIDAAASFILMLADINIISAVLVNGSLLYLLYGYITENREILKSGIMSIMNEAYGIIRAAFSLPEVDGFDKVIQNTALTVNITAGVITLIVTIIITLAVGRYMSKMFYGITVSLLLGLITFAGGTVDIRAAAAILITFVIICILNIGCGSRLSFGNRFRKYKKNIYKQKNDSIYVLQLCLIACIIGTLLYNAASDINIGKSFKTEYSSDLKITARDIAVMKYEEYKNFNNANTFDEGQVGYQSYFRPTMKKIKTVKLKAVKNESSYITEFIGQDYIYRMNMWTKAEDTNDINSYLYIDDNNKEIIDKICSEQNFASANDTAKAVSDYLINNYTYSIDTEPVSYGKDFVNSFLEDTKSGNSTHFASAAVLIFRNMGIPARYVSGYKVDNEQIVSGKYDKKSGEFNVDISRANSYAWVEIYDNEKGWSTVNVSDPPDIEKMKELIDSKAEEDTPNTDVSSYFRSVDREKYAPKRIGQNLLRGAVKIVIVIVLFTIVAAIIIAIFILLKKYIIYIKSDNSQRAVILIDEFCKKSDINTNSLNEIAEFLKEKGNSPKITDEFVNLSERIIFSPESCGADVKKLHRILKSLKK